MPQNSNAISSYESYDTTYAYEQKSPLKYLPVILFVIYKLFIQI